MTGPDTSPERLADERERLLEEVVDDLDRPHPPTTAYIRRVVRRFAAELLRAAPPPATEGGDSNGSDVPGVHVERGASANESVGAPPPAEQDAWRLDGEIADVRGMARAWMAVCELLDELGIPRFDAESARAGALRAIRELAAPPPQQTEPAEVWIVEGRDHHGNIVRLGAPHWTKQEAEENAKYFHLIKNWPKDDVWFVPLYRSPPPALEPGQRMEGVAFKDGDAFCAEGGERCEESESWTFVPECKHECADEMITDSQTKRAYMVIIHGATGEGTQNG